MRKILVFCIVLIGLASCDICDLFYMFDKLSYYSYLHNESGKDVTVILNRGSYAETEYRLKDGEELEIPDTDRWGLYVKGRSTDTVWFEFADSTVTFHTYMRLYDQYGRDSLVYVPLENNIYDASNTGEGSWKNSRIRPQKYRLDYTVK